MLFIVPTLALTVLMTSDERMPAGSGHLADLQALPEGIVAERAA
ncbi:hypothetical protein [Luteimonas sp. TWI1416]